MNLVTNLVLLLTKVQAAAIAATINDLFGIEWIGGECYPRCEIYVIESDKPFS